MTSASPVGSSKRSRIQLDLPCANTEKAFQPATSSPFTSPMQFAFLVLEEHPWGREMLRTLLERGFEPTVIIQEVSRVGDEERDKFLTRIAGQPVPPRLTELVAGRNTPMYCVANHNDAACANLLKANEPAVLVLGGTRIIKPHVIVAALSAMNSMLYVSTRMMFSLSRGG